MLELILVPFAIAVQQLPQTNPGFNNAPFKFTKYSNAYMLVYIRESDKDKVVCNVDEIDIAEHLRVRIFSVSLQEVIIYAYLILLSTRIYWFLFFQTRLKKEQEEKEDKRKYKAQAHLYTIIKVIIFILFFFMWFIIL